MDTEEREIEITVRVRIERKVWRTPYNWNLPRPWKPFCALCDSHGTLRNGNPCPSCDGGVRS